MASSSHIFVVTYVDDEGEMVLVEAHTTQANAKAAVKELTASGSEEVEVTKLELKTETGGLPKRGKAESGAKAKGGKAVKSEEAEQNEEEDDENDDAGGNDDTKGKAKPKKTAKPDDGRKEIPDGLPGVLKGLKLLFTGTFDHMDRNTSKATAEKYGAEVISNIKNTDYVVMGVKAGQKKIDEIEKLGLDTVDEAGFYEMLEKGVPEDKRQRIAAAADAEPAKKKQKK